MSKRVIKQGGSVWKAVQGRGMQITQKEIDNYRFDHLDYLIAESMLSGCNSVQAIAVNLQEKQEVIRDRLLFPVRCAWISRELIKGVQSRMGNVISAVFHRAVTTGDVSAAKFLCKKFDQYKEPAQEHKHLHLNLDNMTTDQIDKLINDKKRKLNIDGDEEEG